MRCSRCQRDGFSETALNWQVVGYERIRSQGGANQIQNRRRTGKAICNSCLHEVKEGVHPDQERLV